MSILVAALGLAIPVAAQDRLFIPGSQDSDGYEIGALGRFGEVLGPSRGLARPLVGGGRFAVVGATVYDLRTGAARPLPAGAEPAAFDPARPRVFVVMSIAGSARESIAAFDVVSGSTSPVADVPACPTPFGPRHPSVHYAAGAERLFIERCAANASEPGDVLVFDLAASPPPLVVTIPASLPSGADMLPSPDGTRLFIGAPSAFGAADPLVAYDTASATRVAVVSTSVGTMTWDDVRGWLLVATRLSPGFNEAVSVWTPDLAPVGTAEFAGVGPCGVRVQVSAHTGRIYVTTGGSDYYGTPGVAVAAFGGQPPVLLSHAPLAGGATTTCNGAVVRTAPGAPRNLRAAVTGSTLSLAWQDVGGASSFVLDVGLAPGRTDLSVFLGPDSHAWFANVPPGTYYLRLRGGNEFGGGRPSQEIRVVVP